MGHRIVQAARLPAGPGPHPAASPYDKGIGAALGVTAFGLYQVELPPGAESVPHDHVADGTQDAYAFIAGSGTVLVDGEEVAVEAGDVVAVTPDASRFVRAGAAGLTYIAVCAAPR